VALGNQFAPFACETPDNVSIEGSIGEPILNADGTAAWWAGLWFVWAVAWFIIEPSNRKRPVWYREGGTKSAELVSGAASRKLVAPHGWGSPAGRVDTPASPVLPLEGAGIAELELLWAHEYRGTPLETRLFRPR